MPARHDDIQGKARQGFTLIELSIVLVVIGLLFGAILVGKDLIRAAEIRATISQVEQFRAAVNTFKTKFNALPGDIRASDAAALGFVARTGANGDGNGDGYIGDCTETPDATSNLGCENEFFWTDLSATGLIKGGFTSTTDALITADMSQLPSVLPTAKVGTGAYFTVYSFNNYNAGTSFPSVTKNYFELISIVGVSTGIYDGSATFPLTPIEALNIDAKIDDGLPGSGIVIATAGAVPHKLVPASGYLAPPSDNSCYSRTAPVYTYAPFDDIRWCGLQFDGQF